MHKLCRRLLSCAILLMLVFGIMVPLYVHYTARQFVGAYDTLYLSEHSPYDSILLEVHYQENAEPSDISLDALTDRVKNYTGKRVFAIKYRDIRDDEILEAVGDNDVAALGKNILRNHTQYRTGWFSGNIVIYIMYVGSRWSGDMNLSAAGVTYNADSIILFQDTLPYPELETPVLLHEMGHLWGLPHSNNSDDIMNIHIENYLFSHSFNRVPDDFSEQDKRLLLEKHASRVIFPVKPYEPLYSWILNQNNSLN